MNLRNEPGFYWSLAILYAIGIFLLSSNPKPPEPTILTVFPASDKIAHFFLYLFFGMLLYLAFSRTEFKKYTPSGAAFILGSIYAFTDEVHQRFVPGRSCDALDFLVDAVGIGVGILFLMWKKGEIYKS